MKTFKELPSREVNNGVQYLYDAGNGYGASIVQHDFSYGGRIGKWEIAIIQGENIVFGSKFSLCYITPITDDVLGYLDENEVMPILEQIKALPSSL